MVASLTKHVSLPSLVVLDVLVHLRHASIAHEVRVLVWCQLTLLASHETRKRTAFGCHGLRHENWRHLLKLLQLLLLVLGHLQSLQLLLLLQDTLLLLHL